MNKCYVIYHLTLICLGGHDFVFGDISFNIVWVGSGGLLAIGAVFWRGVVCGGGVGLGGFGFSGVLYAPNHDF